MNSSGCSSGLRSVNESIDEVDDVEDVVCVMVDLVCAQQLSLDLSYTTDTEFSESCSECETSLNSPSHDSTTSSTEIPTPPQQEDDFVEKRTIWDWPLTKDGLAYCIEAKDKFSVTLDFQYLNNEDRIVRKCESYATFNTSWTIGLASVTEDDLNGFWRLEIHIVEHLNALVIEAFRELYKESRRTRNMRTVRKMYKVPTRFDMKTLRTDTSRSGFIILECFRKQDKTPKIAPRPNKKFTKSY